MRVRHVTIFLFSWFCSAQEITLVEKIFSSDVDCDATAECEPENGENNHQKYLIPNRKIRDIPKELQNAQSRLST
jgi:hypothetical protein